MNHTTLSPLARHYDNNDDNKNPSALAHAFCVTLVVIFLVALLPVCTVGTPGLVLKRSCPKMTLLGAGAFAYCITMALVVMGLSGSLYATDNPFADDVLWGVGVAANLYLAYFVKVLAAGKLRKRGENGDVTRVVWPYTIEDDDGRRNFFLQSSSKNQTIIYIVRSYVPNHCGSHQDESSSSQK